MFTSMRPIVWELDPVDDRFDYSDESFPESLSRLESKIVRTPTVGERKQLRPHF